MIRFGNDGWQARFDGSFTEDNVVRVCDALGTLWATKCPGATVYLGFDLRHNSAELARKAAGVVSAHGLRARVSDAACPTPAVAWTCAQDKDAVGAIILTASELSCEYGGILVRGSDGGPVPRDFLDEVEQTISQAPVQGGGAFEECDLMAGYLLALLDGVDREAIASARPKLVVDAMYGSATGWMADLLRDLGCEIIEIHAEKREDFGGIHPEPVDPWADACEQAVVAHGAALGVLLDGDGDRAALVDEHGSIVPVRVMVSLLLEHLAREGAAGGRVVTTLTSSACITRTAELFGLEQVSVPVGFQRIYREVCEGDVLLGAEEYGGVCVPGHLFERDGLLVALLAVEMLARSGMGMSELAAALEERVGKMRYTRRDVRLEPAATQAFRNVLPGLNPGLIADKPPVEVSHADGLRLQFEDDSWVLMRPSRTSPVVRVYAEAATEQQRDSLLEAACQLVKQGV